MDEVRGKWFAYLVLVLLVVGRRLGQIYLDLPYRFNRFFPSPFAFLHPRRSDMIYVTEARPLNIESMRMEARQNYDSTTTTVDQSFFRRVK
jgi:hypothetical protein